MQDRAVDSSSKPGSTGSDGSQWLRKYDKSLQGRLHPNDKANAKNFFPLSVLEKGTTSVVYCALQKKENNEMAEVAVKLFPSYTSVSLIKHEMTILEHVNKIPSEYVVKLYGTVNIAGENGLVMECLNGGNLARWVLNKNNRVISMETRYQLVKSIVAGVQHVHQADIVHYDIKPANFILNQDKDGKLYTVLIDFGLSRFVHEAYKNEGQERFAGTFQYDAPESIANYSKGQASDVFSLAYVIYEVTHHLSIPDDFLKDSKYYADEIYDKVVRRQERPTIENHIPYKLGMLLTECWNHQPAIRPTANECKTRVDNLTPNDLRDVRMQEVNKAKL